MTRLDWLTAAGLGLLALGLRAGSLLIWPCDGLYGQDAYAYYAYAVGPLREALLNFAPPPPFFWPPGYPLLIALGSLLGGTTPFAGQAISLAAGSLTPVLTYALARELAPGEGRGAWAAPLAGLLTAVHPQLWQSSVMLMADATGLAAATLSTWAVARYWRAPRAGWFMLGSGALAFAILTRWAFALAGLAVTALAAGRWLGLARRQPGAAAVQAAAALGVAGVILWPVLQGLLDPAAGAEFTGDLEVYSWSLVNFARREFVTIDGLLSYRYPNGLYYFLLPAHPYYFTPVLAAALAPGVWSVLAGWRARAEAGWPRLLLLLAWPLLVLGFHAGAPWQNFRFGLAALPPLAILAAIGMVEIVAWMRARIPMRRVAQALPAGALLAGLAWMVVGGARLTHGYIARKDRELALIAAVEAQTPLGARLLTFGLTLAFDYYSRLETYELYRLSEADLLRLSAGPEPAFLLLNIASIERQWQGRSPALNYHWLRDHAGLDRLAEYPPYSLYAVRCACP